MDTADDPSRMATVMAEPEGVGAFLRARRTSLGLTYGDVANVVKLPARRIQALEDERWEELPDGPFLRGFLRNVARALDLDAATLTARVDDSLMRARNPESILVSPHAPHATLPRRSGPVGDRHGGRKLIFGAFVFALIAALIAWSGTESFERTLTTGKALMNPPETTSAPTPSSTVAAPATEASDARPRDAVSAPVPSPTTPQVAATVAPAASVAAIAPLALLFHFNEESWVEVKAADGTVLLKSLNAAGSEQQVEGEAPFSLVVGNAKGVALRFRGQPIDLAPYTHDQVARLTLS